MDDRSIIKIFYVSLGGLTLIAAATQWLPRESVSSQLDVFGAGNARAQNPGGNSFLPNPNVAGGLPTAIGGQSSPAAQVPGSPYATQSVPMPPPNSNNGTFGTLPAAASSFVPNPALPTIPVVTTTNPAQEVEGAKILARVGNEVILAGDVIASVNSYLARNGIDPNDPQVQDQKQEFVKVRLKQLVETRIIVNEARRKIPEDGYKKAMEKFDAEFMNSIAPKMAAERKLPGVPELQAQLIKDGSSLDKEQQAFAEAVLSNSWLQQNTKVNTDVSHAELVRIYQETAAKYEYPAQARWEQITVRFDRFPTKSDAYAALAAAGNQVVEGRLLSDVAREVSHGSTASQGGQHPWTKKGSLVSKVLDEALFSLPLKQLSPILEDETGFHIIRILERIEAGRTPFAEVQNEIRKQVIDQRTETAKKLLVDDIRKKTVVWTVFDTPATTVASPDELRYRR